MGSIGSYPRSACAEGSDERAAMKHWLLIVVLLGGCSYTFDPHDPDLPYLGTPPDTASLPHLNTMPVSDYGFVLGGDHRVWLVMQHVDKTWRMMPMSGEPTVDTFEPDVDVQLTTWR